MMSDFDYAELTYLKYKDVESYLQEALPRYGFAQRTMPKIDHGPPDDNGLKKTPGAIVFLNVGSGAGLSHEGSFDRTLITVRIVSGQRQYEQGHRLAMAVDRAFLSFGDSGMLGSVYALGITRSGGPPSLLMQDIAERFHFTGSYATETEAGL